MNFSFTTPTIENNIKEFDEYLIKLLESDVDLIDIALKYIFKNKGKRIRPLLAISFANLLGSVNSRTFVGASMLEIIHTASLIHDDIVDQSNTRRGKPSANAVWDNKVSVLLGDYLFAKSLIIATENNEFEALKVTSNTGSFMSEGELLQIQKSNEDELDESTYFRIIEGKTASLTSASCEIGAISVSASPEDRQNAADFGKLLGLAFQIRDDILDYQVSGDIIGKPVGNDLREKKITLPLLYALNNAEATKKNEIIKLVKSGELSDDEIHQIIDFAITNGGADYSQSRAEKLIEEAKNKLNKYENSESKEFLINFADYIINRNK